MLQSLQGGFFVFSKFENRVKAGYSKDALCRHRNLAQDELMPLLSEHSTQYHKIADAERGYYFDVGKVYYYVRVIPTADNFIDAFQLITYFRLSGQSNENKTFSDVFDSHFGRPFLLDIAFRESNDYIGISIDEVKQNKVNSKCNAALFA
jgi:hypothetical protein